MNVKRDENMDTLVDENTTRKESYNILKCSSNGKHRNEESEDIEKKLRESEERFRLMFEQAAVGMAFASLEGNITQVNQRYCDITGYTREELINRSVISITHPDDVVKQEEVFRHLLESNTQANLLEKRYIQRDSSFRWVNTSTSLIRDAQGMPLHYMAVIIDISERKKAEEERDLILQKEQATRQQASQAALSAAMHANQLETVFASMVDGVFVYDGAGNILQTNAVVRELLALDEASNYFNLPPDERLRLTDIHDVQGNLLSEETQPVTRILRGEVLKGETALDVTIRALDGQVILINISGAPLRDQQGQITGGVMVIRDVTDRRRLERRTQTSLEGLLHMAEALVQLPEHSDDDMHEIYAIGRRLAELTCNILDCQRVGMLVVEKETGLLRPLSIVGLSPEQEAGWWQEQMQQASSLQTMEPQLLARLRAHEVLVLDMMKPPLNNAPNPYKSKVVLVAPMHLRERIIGLLMLDYGSVEHVYTQSEIALASAVATLSALVIERQRLLMEQAEARGREVALQEANRRMEDFLGIASHELRTPLTTIKANVQLAKRRLNTITAEPVSSTTESKVEAAHEMLSRAERQVGVLNRLVGDLIDISRIQTGKLQLHLRKEPSDLVQIVTETVQEQRKATPNRTITLSLPSPDETILVAADPDRIVQVVSNYMTNALKYSAVEKAVKIVLTREKDAQGADIARLSVQDEGQGLSAEDQKHIWECFYQAEGVKVVSGSGVGLGLGLNISQTIIERHHGHTGVDSTPGIGSTFWFTLPLVQSDFLIAEEEEGSI